MTRRRASNGTLFKDFLFLMVLVLLLMVNPPVPPTEDDTKAPGQMIISAVWPEGPVDVDLWVSGPGEAKAVGYSNRGGKLFNLLRDDLGTAGDGLPMNYENAYSRGLPEGEYVANLHCYSCRSGDVTVAVEIRFGPVGVSAGLFVSETLTLSQGQERTVVRFRLNADGKVVPGSVNKVFKGLRSAK